MSTKTHDVVLSMSSDLVYGATMLFWQTVVNIFFREIRPRGAFNIPRSGPVIFVAAPHHNQFLDLLPGLQVYRETKRRVQFLVAAASMKRRVIGFFARLVSSIPVVRAADEAKSGTGRVRLSLDDPCLLLGEETRFLSEFSPRMQVMLPKSVNSLVAEVVEVISDTELRIKREFGGENGKGTMLVREKVEEIKQEGGKGLEFKRIPFIDQQEMFRHVYQCLREGGCIGIFPEGGSHDRTDLLPLKAGVSLMALGAMANDPNCRVKIVPVGLSYFHPHRFRSRAVVEFGAAMDVPQEFVDMFKEGGTRKKEAVGRLLDLIYDGLKTVTVRAPDYDTLMLIQAARRLYTTPGQHLTLGQVVELNRRFIDGYLRFKDDPRIQKLREHVLRYNRLLRDLGLRDHQVPRAQKANWKTLGLLLYRVGLLSVWTIFALPGAILNGPIFLAASIVSRKKAKEALAASSVKVAGRDVLATWKVLISLGLAPVLYGFYAFLAFIIVTKAGAPLSWRIWAPFLVLTSLPFIGYAALKFGEAGMDVLKSLRPLIIALVPGQQRILDKVKAMRAELTNSLADTINEFGPKVYGDFNQFRILVPSASVPPSTGMPDLGPGGIDAHGNLLVHPMTWLDERLFGWSRSAKRVAADGSHSRFGTADVSDEEDDGDYDNILGYLPTYEATGARTKSRQNSYADLQKLRMTASGHPASPEISPPPTILRPRPVSPVDEDHLRFRVNAHRDRRCSLSDRVPVERIGALDRKEDFKDATDTINEEISQKRSRDHV